jgi:hypothetical protein
MACNLMGTAVKFQAHALGDFCMTNEETLLTDSDITVTSALLTIGSKTYPMRNISSVDVTRSRRRWLGAALFGVVAIVGMFPLDAAFVSLGGAAIAAFLWHRGLPRTTLSLNTSGKDAAALTDRDHARVSAIAAAINQALVRQHR